MGCKPTKASLRELNVVSEWENLNLPKIPNSWFQNESERLIYMTINLIRQDPHWPLSFLDGLR